MFKLESYITPIILSYVDKYIQNFKLENSSVSLWGGDACFQNLDLRLDVLEQELQLPVSFVSGHIRELLIHVPWTKLASEPITITINTIECILKLRNSDSSSTSSASGKLKEKSKSNQDVETPPGYISGLINKIVSNIRIYCNNLILKYVEEDIVLSMNIKHCKFESASEVWEPSFIDSCSDDVKMRKLICINDFTICLDKRNAAGKIQVYQEPLLYKCSMTMHLLRTNSSSSDSKALITRLDIYCSSLEFGMSEQQLPMLIRLILHIYALKKSRNEKYDEPNPANVSTETKDSADENETWGNWAWSYVSSILSEPTDQDTLNQPENQGNILQIGFYIDKASVIFKVTDANKEKNAYSHKKLRYMPILALEVQGIYQETVIQPPKWVNSTLGISEILLSPLGHCCCSAIETPEGSKPRPYLRIGSQSNYYKFNSLFDADALENKGATKFYNKSWDFHLITLTESSLLERTPAFAVDFLHEMDVDDDVTPEQLAELVANLEYSNTAERDYTRVFIAPLKMRVCSGLFHRISSLIMAAMTYEYSPYFVSHDDQDIKNLHPPTEEDFEALTHFIPQTTIKVTLFSPTITFEAADHPHFVPRKGKLYKKHKKISSNIQPSIPVTQVQESELAKLIVEFQCIDLLCTKPFYVNRLISTTCQLPEPPKSLFDACFNKVELKIMSLTSRLVLNSKNQTTILMPLNAFFMTRHILKPQYWTDPDVAHSEMSIESENLTLNGTKAKTMVIYDILMGIFQFRSENCDYSNTSLLVDACNDDAFPYMELYVEGIRFKEIKTCTTITFDMSLESVKAFIFETCTDTKIVEKSKDMQQILFISGPESKDEELPLFVATIQYPIKPDVQVHPTFITYNLQEIRICVDPLVFKWFLYSPKYFSVNVFSSLSDNLYKVKNTDSSLYFESSRRHSSNLESVHSSSDQKSAVSKKLKIQKEEPVDMQKRIYNFLRDWFPVWKSMIILGEIRQCIIYFPMNSLCAVGSQGIQEAVEQAINRKNPPDMMIITLPFLSTHCTQRQPLRKFITHLPVKLPETIWSTERTCFPWTLSIEDLSCSTIQNAEKMNFLKPCSLNATIGLSTRKNSEDKSRSSVTDSVSKEEIMCLGICVHVDITPVFISTHEIQVCLFASILYGLAEIYSSISPRENLHHTQSQIQEYPAKILESIDSKSESLLLFHENSFESHHSSIIQPEIEQEAKLTAWLQCTITRCTLELNSNNSKPDKPKLKLVIDTEDIVSSIDFQNVYLKIKSKVGSISVEHYKFMKDKWQPGPYLGLVMRHRDDFLSEERHEDNAFLNITITRASCQHTHTLWGMLHNKKHEKSYPVNISPSRYITELVVSVKPTDILLSFKTLRSFYLVLEPLFAIQSPRKGAAPNLRISNQILPLAYLDCRDMRIVIPSQKKDEKFSHDVFILHVSKISMTPNALNPICRTPYRPDIYQRAARNRILNIPGSEIEDRQYQLNINGVSLNTSTWRNVELILNQPSGILTSLHGTSENPAVEWNNLEKIAINTINPSMHLWPVIEKIDISVVIAPAMVYKEILVCCNSVEINISSDVSISICLSQIKLGLFILGEFFEFSQPVQSTKSKIRLPYTSNSFENTSETLKDSGVESVEQKNVIVITPKNSEFGNELEILITGGKINLSLYAICPQTSRYKSDEKLWKLMNPSKQFLLSDAQDSDSVNNFIPLIFISLAQPNFYHLQEKNFRKINFCLFNASIKTRDKSLVPTTSIPVEKDYGISILDTLCGTPNSDTGIPPAFLTIKVTSTTLDFEMARPTKLESSREVIYDFIEIQREVMGYINDEFVRINPPSAKAKVSLPLTLIPESSEHYEKYEEIKNVLSTITSISLKTNQLVFVWKTERSHKLRLTIGKLSNNFCLLERPDKINNFLSINCLSLLYNYGDCSQLVLNPWTISFDANLFWESWQYVGDYPQVQIIADSDNIILNISPETMEIIKTIVDDLTNFLNDFQQILTVSEDISIESAAGLTVNNDSEQHYKDDLRAGAFQFVNSLTNSPDEMPLPYQVMFWTDNIPVMAWKYPQPRCLTKVRVFPVPLKQANELDKEIEITCSLEYWSDCHATFINFVTFVLPENEILHLDLMCGKQYPPFASVWRIITTITKCEGDIDLFSTFSPKTLAACMRVDSYFNRNLISKHTLGLSISKVSISLFSYFNKKKYVKIPEFLKGFNSDLMFPANQCFSEIIFDNLKLFGWTWGCDVYRIDLNTTFAVNILDYSFLTMQNMANSPAIKFEATIAKSCKFNLISNSISLKFSPSIAHTLAVTSHLWNENLIELNSEREDLNLILLTRYIICNDTNMLLKFGQNDTDEEIILMPKIFNMYCWRSNKNRQELRVALENNKEWLWSNPFLLKPGNQTVKIEKKRLTLNLTIAPLSSAQYQVTISGHLIIANMLSENFELKVIRESKKENKENKKIVNHVIAGNSTTTSIVINNQKNYFLRLRFYGLDSSWTGDIPLMEHSKSAQPWLVKVPLLERGQFLSIWCRVVVEKHANAKRILAMLWPLYTIKSNFSIPTKIRIESPTLNYASEMVLQGCGMMQQLHCPGTIDHSHQLIFLEDAIDSSAGPEIPLSYSLVNHETFFQKMDAIEIDQILESLKSHNEIKWPYLDEDFDNFQWCIQEQSKIEIQVKYNNSNLYSSSLMVEFSPWCLLINTLGCDIGILIENEEVCALPHNGILTPPKIDEIFNIMVCLNGQKFVSDPFQFAKPANWSKTFYMPKILGIIPIDGTAVSNVKCKKSICRLSIQSHIIENIRILKVSSTHVVSNNTSHDINLICFAVANGGNVLSLPNYSEYEITVVAAESHEKNRGVSITKWHTISTEIDETNSNEYAFYMSLSLDPKLGWSKPVRVDELFTRKPTVVTSETDLVPLVLTCNEHKNQIFIAIHHDTRPQIHIENYSGITLYCAQFKGGDEDEIYKETEHFEWYCEIKNNGSNYYSTVTSVEKFPDISSNSPNENLVFAKEPSGSAWSSPVDISDDIDQYMKIPFYGDVNIKVKNSSCLTFILIESTNEVEINAKDIRKRLMEIEENNSKSITPSSRSENASQKVQERIQIQSASAVEISEEFDEIETRKIYSMPDLTKDGLSGKIVSTRASKIGRRRETLLCSTLPMSENIQSIKVMVFINEFTFILLSDIEADSGEINELAIATFDNIGLSTTDVTNQMETKLFIQDIQIDNLYYSKMNYDFPVVMLMKEPRNCRKISSFTVLITPIEKLFEGIENTSLALTLVLDTWMDSRKQKVSGIQKLHFKLDQFCAYIEDTYLMTLADYFNMFLPTNLVAAADTSTSRVPKCTEHSDQVYIPCIVQWHSTFQAKPLTMRHLLIEPISLLLSVHSSIKMYLALDQSPLTFVEFERKRVFTTAYRLGHTLTMHYLSGAIFRAGWMVSSLEILGSPVGLARAMGSGLKDFVAMPFRGFFQGPLEFIYGVTTGSASLMKHLTAGTLQSFTKMASSVARNLDYLTLDEEHVRRTEEQRRQRPSGVTEGLVQGFTGLGISVLGAIGGIAHHPLQSVITEGGSPRSLAAGLGLGLVGIITKPLSAAAELLALTGQGLLQEAGWNNLPEQRRHSFLSDISVCENSILKYEWKLSSLIDCNCKFLCKTEATSLSPISRYCSVALVLTNKNLVIVNTDEDKIEKYISLSELKLCKTKEDCTMLSFELVPSQENVVKIDDDLNIEMDPASRARVADYVKNTVGLLQGNTSREPSEMSISPLSSPGGEKDEGEESNTVFTFYVNPQDKNYFLCMLSIGKQENLSSCNCYPIL